MTNPTISFPRAREVQLEQRARPEPQAGSLLIRSRATLVSAGTEVTILSGEFDPGSAWAAYGVFPFDPGYSSVGVVEEVGEGVDRSWLGRRVASGAPHARYAMIPPEFARSVPDDVADDQATLFALAETVMNGVRRGRVAWGEDVVIFGAGVLGQLAARFCLLAGAAHTVVVDIDPSRLARLPQDASVVGRGCDARAAARGRRARHGGSPRGCRDRAHGLARRNPGRVRRPPSAGALPHALEPSGHGHDVQLPRPLQRAEHRDHRRAHRTSHPPVATPANPWTRERHAELYFALLASGRIDVAPVITRRAPYGEGPAVYRAFLERSSGDLGVVLDWTADGT